MILVDSSVWIDFFRHGGGKLTALLDQNSVLAHPLVIGELACGNLRNRIEILTQLGKLPHAPQATHVDALQLVEEHQLMGRGLGWIDVHLLASAMLAHARLWTLDQPLRRAAEALAVDKV